MVLFALKRKSIGLTSTFKMQHPNVYRRHGWGAIGKTGRLGCPQAELRPTNRLSPLQRPSCILRALRRSLLRMREDPSLGGKFYVVRVTCLEGVDIEELVSASIT